MTVECPYCEKENIVNHDDGYGYDEDGLYQQECRYCGKTFAYDTMISYYHTGYKADCLNGGEHNYKKTHTYPPEFARMRCTMCGDEKAL